MEVWALMQLLLLLMGAVQGQTDELSSEEERKALMLKHLQEVLELSEMSEEETAQEVSLKETEEPDAKEVLEEDPEEEEEEKPEEELPRSTLMTPTTVSPTQDEEDGFTYVFSRLNSLDAAVHRLNVQFYHMDLRVSQFSQGLAKLKGDLSEEQESLASLNEIATRNQKELGRIDGCLRGRRTQTKCFLVFKHFEGYDGAQKLCEARGGQLAMPADATEMAVLRRYLHDAFHPYNWPAWVGIHDRRSEGLWLFENGHRVSVFDWYRDHLVTQPNGGARENCVSLSSDDGKWWDNDCERRMYYVCEYRL